MKLQEFIENNINVKNVSKILNEIRIEIKDNKNAILKVNEIDLKYSDMKIDIDNLIDMINEFKILEKEINEEKTIFISYFGNPYITLNLIMLALSNNCKLILDTNDTMLGVNEILINIVNNVLKEYKIKEMIYLNNLSSIKEISNYENKIDKFIFIDNYNGYSIYKSQNIKNAIYYPIFSLDLYCIDEELEELKVKIFEYANNIGTDIEIYDEYDIDEVIDIINEFGTGNIALILTKSKDEQEKFRKGIKGKKVLINVNPFKELKVNIDYDIFFGCE